MKTEADSHYCGKCNTTLTTLADFLIHKLQHIGHGKGLGCELCGLGYNRAAPLQNHYKSKHGLEIFAKRHFVKIPRPPSKDPHSEPSSSSIISSSCSTSTSSPALKHLLSTPFVGSSSATTLTSFIDNSLYEAKLPSASRNLQSAKDKLTTEFGLLSREKKMTPAESLVELCSNQTQLITGEGNCSGSGIHPGSPQTHLTADSDLSVDLHMSSASAHMPSAPAHMLSGHQHVSSAHIQMTSGENAETSLMCSETNLSDVEATDLVTSDVMFSSHPLDMSSTSTHLNSEVSGLNPTHSEVSGLNPTHSEVSGLNPTHSEVSGLNPTHSEVSGLNPTHSEVSGLNSTPSDVSSLNPTPSDVSGLNSTPSDVSSLNPTPSDVSSLNPTPSEVSGLDPTPSEVTGLNHTPPSDVSGLTPSHGDISGLDSAQLPGSNLTNVEKPTEDSDKIPVSKTVHVVITKADGDEIHAGNSPCCSMGRNSLETGESVQDDRSRSNHVDDSSESVHDEKHRQTDIKETCKNHEEQNSKTDFHFILLANPVKGRVLSYHKNQFKCLHCNYKTSWVNSLIKHMKTFHEDLMSIHENIEVKSVHNSPNRRLVKMSTYTAEMHSLKKSSRSKRGRSVEKQDRPGEFACKTCDKVFNRLRYLRKHMQVHRTEKKHLCDECGKSFKTRPYLLSHYRVHKIKEYQCSQCDFRSSINAVIHAHRQLHHEDSVLCDICGFAYNDKSTLKKHKLVHDPSRPHPCTFPGCTWRFNSKVMCLAHIRAHTSEGKFQCSLCSYVFRQNHHLQRHTAKVHGICKPNKKVAHKKSEQTEDEEDDPSSVRLILDYSQMEVDNFSSVLQNGQLVIATDSEGNTVNYQVADITMNVSLLENSATDGQTVLIPNSDCGQIIYQESEIA